VTPALGPQTHPWLDRIFLDRRWGVVGSLAVFAAVLFVVFQVSAWLDEQTTQRLAAVLRGLATAGVREVVAARGGRRPGGPRGYRRAYMIPLVALLVALEQCGVMPRIARVCRSRLPSDRRHGGVAVTVSSRDLGCNVPAISSVAAMTTGPRAAGGERAQYVRALLCALGDHPRARGEIPRRLGRDAPLLLGPES
jgi:ferrous iron transport protein B